MKMKQKILNNMVYIAVVAVLITTTLIGMFTYYRYMEQIKTGMKDEAAYLAASLNFEDQQNLDKYKNITITRITRIAKDGTVIYDSSGKEKSMGNHKNRTEVKEAFKHGHGEPKMARAVGNALHKNPDPEDIPCFRVVNSKGELSGAFAFGGKDEQARRLIKDGVEVVDGKVDLSKYGI